MKYAVGSIDEVTWFANRFDGDWSDTKKHVPEIIAKLEDAGMLDQFLREHSAVGEDGETYVDMDSVFDELYLEPDEVLKKYIKGG